MTKDEQEQSAQIVGNKAFNELMDLRVDVEEAYRVHDRIKEEFKRQTNDLLRKRKEVK